MDSLSSYTPYYGYLQSDVFLVTPDTGDISLKAMWGVTPMEYESYGLFETDPSCLIKQSPYLHGSNCVILNSVELQLQQMNALTSITTMELLLQGPSFIQIIASTFSTDLKTTTNNHPQCNGNGTGITCTELKDLSTG